MSLILDALRRADRSRERDVGRRVTQAMPPRASSPSPARAGFVTAIVVTAAAAGIVGWLARPASDTVAAQPSPPRIIEIAPRVRGSSLAQIAVPAREGPDSPTLPPAPPLSTLSDAVQASVPPLSVDAHVWSEDPSKRFVMLNGRLYRDGDFVQDGLRLVAVVADGAELEWRGVRFRVPAQ